jgi:hypothetical protein
MKKLILFFCLFLFSNYANAQTDCSAYHKGYFMYTDSAGNTMLIHRKNKYQYEYNRKNNERTQFLINWKSDCEYSITQTLTNTKSLKKYKNFVYGFAISKSDGNNGYYYSCICKDDIVKGKESFIKKITKQEFYNLY